MGDLRIEEVSYAAVDAYISRRKADGRRTRTIILELRLLSQALRHASDSGLLAAVPKLPKLADRDRRPARFLTPEESVLVLAELRPLDEQPIRPTRGRPPIRHDRLTYLAVLVALNLGLRKGEILSRCWQDVRWSEGPHGAIAVTHKPEIGYVVKKSRERVVPMPPELAAELAALHRDLGCPARGWIFPSPGNPERPRRTFAHALNRACDRAGVPRIHPHGLRHTWASRLAVAGVDRRTLMELGAWTDGRMLDEVYAHVTDAHKTEVMARNGIGLGGPPVGNHAGSNDGSSR